MYQFYVLAIVFNVLGGVTLAFDFVAGKVGIARFLNDEAINAPNFRAIVGLLTFVVGFVKLFTVTEGNWVILGDFVPALAALVTGSTLLIERYREWIEERFGSERGALLVSRLDKVFIGPRNVYGIVSIAAAIAHFFFHGVQLL